MFREYPLVTFSDSKGKLTPIELKDFDMFEVKRVYFAFDNLMDRGGHAHIEEQEFFFMTKGSCTARLNDGVNWHEIKLEVGKNALYVGRLVWHEFVDLSADAVLTALSSTSYNPNRSDYIEDINIFFKQLNV